MNSNSDVRQYIKDAILTEYTSLTEAAIRRVSAQSSVIGWLIGLTGTLIGLLIAFSPPGMNYPILLSLIYKPSVEALIILAFLCAGYVIAVELLISYWIYQLFHMFRVAHYIIHLEERYKEYLKINSKIKLLNWESYTKGFEDVRASFSNYSLPVKLILEISKYLQPLSLYIMALLGIIGLITSIVMGITLEINISINMLIFLISISFLLVISLPFLAIVHFSLYKWSY